jgi:hypothetical protein
MEDRPMANENEVETEEDIFDKSSRVLGEMRDRCIDLRDEIENYFRLRERDMSLKDALAAFYTREELFLARRLEIINMIIKA